MISVKGISKSYSDESNALDQISFDVQDGEVLYIMGASGSGKSTLLKLIAGLEDADQGEIKIYDELITGPEHNLVPGYDHIAHVSQNFKLQPYLRISENIARSIPYLDEEEKESRIAEVLEICRLSAKVDDYPPNLSGGEQQRACIAVHIAHEPDVLLLDEPFSNLDLPQKLDLQEDLMRIIKLTETTAIVVSHDPLEAMALADHILIMDKGHMVQRDSPQNIYVNPKNKLVAKLMGPVNELNIDGSKLLVRPEHIKVHSSGTFEGVVIKSTFQGNRYLIHCETEICQGALIIQDDVPYITGQAIKFRIN